MPEDTIRLSTEGSDRATAYNMSNKLARRGDDLIVGWLDGPASEGESVRIRVAVCDVESGEPRSVIQLGEGIDNHCGPALSVDDSGRVHAVVGAHHGDFLYHFSDEPSDTSSWSEPEHIGPRHSYPALVIDPEGTLHLAYRESGDRWQLHYTRKKAGAEWELPVVIAQSPTKGYNHFMHSLSIGPTGTLHLTFQFHFSETGINTDCLTKSMSHISSIDRGDTWTNLGDPCTFPLTIGTTNWIFDCFDDPAANMRIGTHVVDRNDHAWLFASLPGPDRGVIWRQTEVGWTEIDLSEVTPDLQLSGGKSTAISYDREDRVHLLVSTTKKKEKPGWSDPENEVFHLVFELKGTLLSNTQITTSDPDRAHWLPAIEHWDWCRPREIGVNGHWYLYTAGNNAGLMSQSNYNDLLRTEVHLGRLAQIHA
jgi:hypothetical protein